MSDHTIEALLRPPVELYSAATALSCAVIAFSAPWALMLPPRLGFVAGTMACVFATYRMRQGLTVLRYQRGLKRYRMTKIAPAKIPVSDDRLYLGEGFKWDQKHTQRKMDATRPEARPFVEEGFWFKKVRQFERWSKSRAGLRWLSRITSSPAWWNPVAPVVDDHGEIVDLGGSPILHGVELHETPVYLGQKHRVGHTLILGTTRVGKTRLMEILVTQDIHGGKVVIVIDPKGDADLMLRIYAESARANRLHHLYLFHLGYPDISARYNGIGNFARVTEIATRTTNALPSSGNSAAFKEFAWRFTNLVAQAQVALGRVPTYDQLLRDISDIEPLFLDYARHTLARSLRADWATQLSIIETQIKKQSIPVSRSMMDRNPSLIAMVHYLKETPIADAVLNGLVTAVRYEKSFFEKIVASLGPFLEKLTTGNTGKLISPDYFDSSDQRPIFDWMQIIRQGGIVYAGLDALSDTTVAGAVGNSMLADLVSVGGKLYKTGLDPHHSAGKIILPKVACHFDEVNELAGPEFIPMVNKIGGAGFMVHAYTQTIPDIEAKVGDAAKAEQILGNFNNVIMLRVKSHRTARFFTDQLPQVDVSALTMVSGVTDAAGEGNGKDFVSRNEDRVSTQKVPLLEPSDIMALPQGQAFALLEGNRLSKIRMPMPDTQGDKFIPSSLKAVGEAMRQKYRTGDQWWQESDWPKDHPIGLSESTSIPVDYVPPGNAAVPLSPISDTSMAANGGEIPATMANNAMASDAISTASKEIAE